MQTIRLTLRSWFKSPLFAVVAIGTLALAIGANTLVFSLLNTILLRDLPYPGAERLVYVWNTYPKQGLEKATLSVPDYLDRKDLPAFDGATLYHSRSVNLAEEGTAPERLRALRTTPSFFSLFGARFTLGRGFGDDEAKHGADKFAVLTHEFWTSRFAADRNIVGRQLRLSGESYTVLGVTAPGFLPPHRDVALILPFAFAPDEASDQGRGREFATMVARLAPGATAEQAMRQSQAVLVGLEQRIPQAKAFFERTGFGALVTDYLEENVGETRPILYLLQGGVLLLLVVAGANVANLLLLRAVARQREMAIRTALGARRGQLARQLVTEGLLLSLTGAALGLALSVWGAELVRLFGFADLPRLREFGLDATVLGFSLGLAVLIGVGFGLAPLLGVRRDVSAEALKDSNSAATAGRNTGWLRHLLIATEVALAVVLLAGSALLGRSFLKLREVSVGFRAENVVTGTVAIPFHRYDTDAKANAFYERVLERVKALPGVEHAGYTSQLPFGGGVSTGSYQLPGVALPPDASPHANMRWVNRDFFRALGVPLMRGRFFAETDTLESPKVAIIDQYLADKYFPGQDPVGRELRPGGGSDGQTFLIVGVAGTIRHASLAEPVAKETIYFATEQDARGSVTFVIRGGEPGLIASGLREAVRGVDPELPVFDVRTMDERIAGSLDARRAPMLLLLGFSVLALALSGLGIYGIVAFSVSQRAREIGIRMALGADRKTVLQLVLGEGLKLAAFGAAAGLLLTLAGGRWLQGQLYGVAAHDLPSLLIAVVVVVFWAFIGCLLPAWKASRLNPLTALRND